MVPRIIRLRPTTFAKLAATRKEAERAGAYRVAKRIHAVLLNSQGRSSGQLAELLHAPRSRVSAWLSDYESHGMEGLLEGFRPGRPARITDAQIKVLYDIIESGPVAYGLDSGLWTSPMAARIIRDEFGLSFHPGHVRKLLHQIGFSVQRPRRVLARADAVAQDRWHRRVFPDLKKKPKEKAAPSSSRTRQASDRTQPSTRRGVQSPVRRKSL